MKFCGTLSAVEISDTADWLAGFIQNVLLLHVMFSAQNITKVQFWSKSHQTYSTSCQKWFKNIVLGVADSRISINFNRLRRIRPLKIFPQTDFHQYRIKSTRAIMLSCSQILRTYGHARRADVQMDGTDIKLRLTVSRASEMNLKHVLGQNRFRHDNNTFWLVVHSGRKGRKSRENIHPLLLINWFLFLHKVPHRLMEQSDDLAMGPEKNVAPLHPHTKSGHRASNDIRRIRDTTNIFI